MFAVQGTRGAEPGTPTGGAAEQPENATTAEGVTGEFNRAVGEATRRIMKDSRFAPASSGRDDK
jgi:hypothetical protein